MATYKCKCCLFKIDIPVPKRQPLCPTCPHHPRMYPAHYEEVKFA